MDLFHFLSATLDMMGQGTAGDKMTRVDCERARQDDWAAHTLHITLSDRMDQTLNYEMLPMKTYKVIKTV